MKEPANSTCTAKKVRVIKGDEGKEANHSAHYIISHFPGVKVATGTMSIWG